MLVTNWQQGNFFPNCEKISLVYWEIKAVSTREFATETHKKSGYNTFSDVPLALELEVKNNGEGNKDNSTDNSEED